MGVGVVFRDACRKALELLDKYGNDTDDEALRKAITRALELLDDLQMG